MCSIDREAIIVYYLPTYEVILIGKCYAICYTISHYPIEKVILLKGLSQWKDYPIGRVILLGRAGTFSIS